MFTNVLAALALALASSFVAAFPVSRQSCGTPNYGPFKLFATTQDGQSSAIRLVNMGPDDNNNTIMTMTTCDTCGQAPAYWQLNDQVLTPVFFDDADGQSTVNMPVSQGKVNFVSGSDDSVAKTSTYCATRNPTASNGLPGYLAVNGNAESFSICSFIGTPGPAHRRDVYFNQQSNRIASNCVPAHLVMQSTGFVPEPIN